VRWIQIELVSGAFPLLKSFGRVALEDFENLIIECDRVGDVITPEKNHCLN